MASLGNYALMAALISALSQMIFPLQRLKSNPGGAYSFAQGLAILQLFFLVISFLSLIYVYASSDFTVLNVALNSHSQLSLFYKIAGAWSNYEGSMLLWVFALGVFGALAVFFSQSTSHSFMTYVLIIQGIIVAGFACFVLFFANPFQTLFLPLEEGKGLNPILHDPSLAFHPPLLYFGYLGFSLCFSFTVAGLLTQKIDQEWAKWVRPWVLLSWSFLTIGITLGSWWAYYELGWGGWWFWDPVENASLMPWLIGVALIHSLMVLEKQGTLKIWSAFLGIHTFSLCLLGSFLVRSGVVSSVHSFAYDPERGVFIFVFIAIAFVGGLTLLLKRVPSLLSKGSIDFISREGAILILNLLFIMLTLVVFVGTIFPIIYEMLSGVKGSAGPVFYNRLIIPLFSLVLIMMLIGPSIPWNHNNIKSVLKSLIQPFIISLGLFIFALFYFNLGVTLSSLILFLAINLVCGIFNIWWKSLREKAPLSPSFYRMAIAHGGVAIMIFGISIDSLSKKELVTSLTEGGSLPFLNYAVKLLEVNYKKDKIYLLERATLLVSKNGNVLATLYPERRIYLSDETMTTETAQFHDYFSDLYVVLGQHLPDNQWAIKISYHPQVLWIWIGGLLIALGGLLGINWQRKRFFSRLSKQALSEF